MKKALSILTVSAMLICSLVFGACGNSGGGLNGQKIDKNKTQIYINVYNGGTGTQWITDEAIEYNKKLDKYQIYINEEKRNANFIIEEVNAASGIASAYFSVDTAFQELIYGDKLVDLTPLLEKTVEGETRKIGDKLKNAESWSELASKNGQGCYLLPYSDSVGGLVFDYKDFVDKGWLNYANGKDAAVTDALAAQGIEFTNNNGKLFYVGGGDVNYAEGDRILTAGKDGKFGTYDDGQPQTIEEWNTMFGKIKSKDGSKPIIFPGEYPNYTGMVQNAFFAQYAGVEAFENYFAFDSDGKQVVMRDGSKEVITIENGYKYFGMKEIYDTVSFMSTYFASENLHSSTNDNSDHRAAQRTYLYSPVSDGKIPYAAMICEGIWWENEARQTFKLANDQSAKGDRGFGMRDYRYMLLPYIEGQKGIDGNGGGSVLAGQDTGSFFVVKEKNAEKTEILIDFLAQTLSDRCLESFTAETGVIRAFDYEISDEKLAGMTPFARNVWQMYNDTENIAVVRPFQERIKAPVAFATDISLDGVVFPYREKGVLYGSDTCVVSLLGKNKNTEDIFGLIKDSFTETTWSRYVNSAKEQGFYK